ncbi:MAG: cupin domain-containing protein [Clostridia bacterium]|nr:cupin domain-containing protein [Clostridia bacterium]
MEEQIFTGKGDKPAIINISAVARTNNFYRKEIWTGENLQLTVMSIPIGGEVGLEIHNGNDQFIGVEYGIASVYFGETKQGVRFVGNVNSDYVITVPAGTWHNIINDGNQPLKIYSVYAPPHHPKGTVHKTKFDSDLADY